MPRGFLLKLDPKLEMKVVRSLTREILRLRDPNTVVKFLERFFTKEEIKFIMRRIAIAQLLQEGKTYRQIRKFLGVSQNTISNAGKIIKGKNYDISQERKKQHLNLFPSKNKKEKKLFRPYKGAESIV